MNTDLLIGIGVTLKEIPMMCGYVRDDEVFSSISHFSLGFSVNDDLSQDYSGYLDEMNISTSIHTVDLNLTDILNMKFCNTINSQVIRYSPRYIEEDLGVWRYKDMFLAAHLVNPMLNETSLENAIDNIYSAKEVFNTDIAFENPPVYWSDDDIEFWNFCLKLCKEAKCIMAFDVGHYIGQCISLGMPVVIPSRTHEIWKYIKTIHVSGMQKWVWNGVLVWVDKHDKVFDQYLVEFTKECLDRCKNVSTILLEVEGASKSSSMRNIAIIKNIVGGLYAE